VFAILLVPTYLSSALLLVLKCLLFASRIQTSVQVRSNSIPGHKENSETDDASHCWYRAEPPLSLYDPASIVHVEPCMTFRRSCTIKINRPRSFDVFSVAAGGC